MLSKFPSFRIDHFKLLILHLVKLSTLHFALFSFLSAGAPDTLWTKTYGGTKDEHCYEVQQTSDGGFIVTGQTFSFGSGGSDVYLIRTDPNGDTLWTKTYGGTRGDYGSSVKQTSDEGFIIAGCTKSFGDTLGDVYLIRTASNGDTLWTKTYGRADNDHGEFIQQTSDGGFIISGSTHSYNAYYSDAYLIQLNSNGDTLWTKNYGGDNNESGNSVQQTNDGGFIIAGYTGSFGDARGDVYLIRTNSYGDTLWTKNYGGQEFDYSLSIQKINNNGFIIVGSTSSFGAGESDVYLIRTNSNGDTLWTKTYGSTSSDWGSSVYQTNNGGFIITGTKMYDDLYLIYTNSNGDTLWTNTYGGDLTDYGQSVLQTKDEGFIVAGDTQSYGSGMYDIYLIRLDKDTTAIQQEIPINFLNPKKFIVSYNNNNLISIRYTIQHSSSVKLEAYDIKGKLVKVIQNKFMHKGSYSVHWDSKRFGSGIYYIKLSIGKNSSIRKAVILK